jgi:uncharacterized membrane protein
MNMARKKITSSPRETVNPESAEEALAPEMDATTNNILKIMGGGLVSGAALGAQIGSHSPIVPAASAAAGAMIGALGGATATGIGASVAGSSLDKSARKIARLIPKIKERKLENQRIRRGKKGK